MSDNAIDSNQGSNREEKIEIRLSEIGDAKIFKNAGGGKEAYNEIIQTEARDEFKRLIEERINKLNSKRKDNNENDRNYRENTKYANYCKNLDNDFRSDDCDFDILSDIYVRQHDTILIDGERGAGKTTFILNMFNEIKNYKIENLSILDPTLIENKEHILINIISRIKKKVDNFFIYKSGSFKGDHELYAYWKKWLSKLAAGLSLLDGIGSDKLNNELWDSPELAMEDGIDNALSGQELEKRFHKFIDVSLKLLCKDAFILFLDDIDTSIDKGFIIMEVLRKYLTSPKLIIVLSGDIKLYSLIIKQLQIKKIDPKGILKDYIFSGSLNQNDQSSGKIKDTTEINEIRESIDVLQDQYITKILKPEFRITLKPIYHYKERIIIVNDLFNEKSQTSIEENSEYLQIVLDNFCLDVFSIKEKNDILANAINEFVTQLPVRTFLQLIKVYYLYFKSENQKINKTNRLDFINSLISMFVSYFDVNVLRGQSIESDFAINRISEYLLNKSQNYSEELYSLLPIYGEKKINSNMFLINAISSYILKEKPHKILEYMLKLYLPRYCMALSEDTKSSKDKNVNLKKIVDYLSLETDNEFADAAKKSVVFFQGTTNLYPFTSGFIHVNKSINDEKKIINQSLFLDAILFNISYKKANSTYLFASFFSILSLMSEVLSLTVGFRDKNLNNKDKINLIKNKILENSYIKTFSSISDQNYGIEIFDEEDEENENFSEDYNTQEMELY